MPLVRESFESPTAEQLAERSNAMIAAGQELVRTTCRLLDAGKYTYKEPGKNLVATDAAYHLQEGLPPDHGIAVWSESDGRDISLWQRVVRWTGQERDKEIPVSEPHMLLYRSRYYDDVTSLLDGINPGLTHDEVMDRIWDTHETIVFLGKAHGYTARPIKY